MNENTRVDKPHADKPRAGITRRPYQPRARALTADRIVQLAPDMRRIVLVGDDLEATLPHPPMACADHVKIVVPDENTGELRLPEPGGARRPAGDAVVMRDYTVRRFDPDRRELTIDFVLHDHGPTGRWAIGAAPGSRLGVLGPRGSTLFPADRGRYVIGVDETGLPAAERWIAETPAGATLEAYILVADARSERELPNRPGLTVRWLHRSAGGDLAGALLAAVTVADPDTFVWAAGEAGALAPVRRHLRGIGFDPDGFAVQGYWKHGEAGHHEGPGGHR